MPTVSMLHAGINLWALQPPQRSALSSAELVELMEDHRVRKDSDLEDILPCGVCMITEMQEETVQMRPNQDELLPSQ